MRLWQFSRLQGSKIKIDNEIGQPLGLVDGSQVFSTMFRYDYSGNASSEIVLSTFGPENYKQLCSITIYMIDMPGACAQASKFLADRNVDILNSVSLSTITGVTMVWRMLADLSYYGEPVDLKADFDSIKKQRSSTVDKMDNLEIDISHIADRFTKGAAAHSKAVKTKQIRSKNRSPSKISNGEFTVPAEFLEALGRPKDGQPMMLVGDEDSYTLSISTLDPSTKLIGMSFVIPDRPGTINQVTEVLAKHDVNLLAVHTKVRVYYESMSMDIVADVSKSDLEIAALMAEVTELLSKLKGSYEVISFENIQF